MLELGSFKEILAKKRELYLRIKVIPGAGKNLVLEVLADETVKIALKAQAEKGKANLELISFLASEFKVSKENIKIISGHSSRLKLLKICLS
ncbi:DUF167 domain-containing protein [Candidatus Falkowbacteria bacterium]|nr:DUF167 domain-containing protein [Candidatus Falkowbacteria bacterium]